MNVEERDGEATVAHLLKSLLDHRQRIARITLTMMIFAAAVGAAYMLWLQPTRWTMSSRFRPTFSGVEQGKYPNGLAFAASDITAPSVVDAIYDREGIKDFCAREVFRSAFIVELRSPQLQLLDAEFQSRLSDTRLSGVDRQRIVEDYNAQRKALQIQYRLTFMRPPACRAIPEAVVGKAMDGVLAEWATQAENRRGVAKLRVSVLTPSVFNLSTIGDESRLTRADLIRATLRRVITNIEAVEALPGAELVRYGQDLSSLAEIRAAVEDLNRWHLEPLILGTASAMGEQAIADVTNALQNARALAAGTEQRAAAYRMALREFSGTPTFTAADLTRTGNQRAGAEVPNITPQIDASFLDRLTQLVAANANSELRQELTRKMAQAAVDGVEYQVNISYYTTLLENLKRGLGSRVSGEEVDRRLDVIVKRGRQLVELFDRVYEEFSKVSLRPEASLYQIEMPPSVSLARPFTPWDYLTAILGVGVFSLLFASFILLARDRLAQAR